MPVTFKVATHDADPIDYRKSGERTADDLLNSSWGSFNSTPLKGTELLQSTFGRGGAKVQDTVLARTNGFVHTATSAYNQHHHLTIRPDDVWIAILSQFNFYVNAHAEELRSHFVAHEGKKELTITTVGSRYTVDFGSLSVQFTDLLHREVVDKTLKDWILPDFSTTTQNDTITASVLMMSTLKAYFSYGIELSCGIPSVTLEGEKSDWESLLARIDKLPSFGDEPTQWATYLRPILSRFVSAFDGAPDVDFWGKICHHHSGGSGPTYISGWITAFCLWSTEGKWFGGATKSSYAAVVDGLRYPVIETGDVPAGFAEVDVKLDDNGEKFDCVMAAGHVASEVFGEKGDGIRPYPGWFMFIKGVPMTQEELYKLWGLDNLLSETPMSST